MNGKGPKKKKKAARRAAAGGLLARWFGDAKAKDKKAGKAAKAPAPEKKKPLSPLERSIQEIKQMTKVGKSDPERLAMMLSKLLQSERAKTQRAQEHFDKMVWDIVHKKEAGDAAAAEDAPPGPEPEP